MGPAPRSEPVSRPTWPVQRFERASTAEVASWLIGQPDASAVAHWAEMPLPGDTRTAVNLVHRPLPVGAHACEARRQSFAVTELVSSAGRDLKVTGRREDKVFFPAANGRCPEPTRAAIHAALFHAPSAAVAEAALARWRFARTHIGQAGVRCEDVRACRATLGSLRENWLMSIMPAGRSFRLVFARMDNGTIDSVTVSSRGPLRIALERTIPPVI